MSATTRQKDGEPSVLSLAQLLEQQPPTAPPVIEPGPLPPQGICSSAESRSWANRCWSLTSRCRWPPARIPPAFPSRLRAVCWSAMCWSAMCWSASSNCPSRSSSAAWPPWTGRPVVVFRGVEPGRQHRIVVNGSDLGDIEHTRLDAGIEVPAPAGKDNPAWP